MPPSKARHRNGVAHLVYHSASGRQTPGPEIYTRCRIEPGRVVIDRNCKAWCPRRGKHIRLWADTQVRFDRVTLKLVGVRSTNWVLVSYEIDLGDDETEGLTDGVPDTA